jgi:hypothetical protein
VYSDRWGKEKRKKKKREKEREKEERDKVAMCHLKSGWGKI